MLILNKNYRYSISDYLIVTAFGKDQLNKIKEEVLKKKRLKRQMEEDMNMAAIFQIEVEEKQEILLRERNATFDCLIV